MSMTPMQLRQRLDDKIRFWRKIKGSKAAHYRDAYQTVRIGLFGRSKT